MEHFHEFDLNQDPFQNEPDLRFFCASPTHRRAKLRVDRALRQSKGLVVLAGEGGTGKSLLARSIFEELEEEVFESSLMVMMQGTADSVSVLRRFSAQLGMEEPPTDRSELLAVLYDQLAVVREDGRHAVLIIDDAHVLGQDAMAEIAGLLSFEYEDRRLISLLLVGLPELDEIVAAVPALAERVDVRVRLDALSEGEAAAYLAHRVEVAGGTPEIFEASAVKAIYALGQGRPRRMNTLADNALFEAFLSGHEQVSEEDVHLASDDLPFVAATPGFATHRAGPDDVPAATVSTSLLEDVAALQAPPALEDDGAFGIPSEAAFAPAEVSLGEPEPEADAPWMQEPPEVQVEGPVDAPAFGVEPFETEALASAGFEEPATDLTVEPPQVEAAPFETPGIEDEGVPAGSVPTESFGAQAVEDVAFGTTLDDIDDAELHLDVPVESDVTSFSETLSGGAVADEGSDGASSLFDDFDFAEPEGASAEVFGTEPRHRAEAFELDESPISGPPPVEAAPVDEFDDLFADLIDD